MEPIKEGKSVNNKKIVALLLSAFVLPGSGHFYLKKNIKGLILSLSTFVCFLYPLIRYSSTLNKSLQSIPLGDQALLQSAMAVSNAWSLEKGTITPSVVIIFCIWLYAIVDIILTKNHQR